MREETTRNASGPGTRMTEYPNEQDGHQLTQANINVNDSALSLFGDHKKMPDKNGNVLAPDLNLKSNLSQKKESFNKVVGCLGIKVCSAEFKFDSDYP